jgi:hypothetical protein
MDDTTHISRQRGRRILTSMGLFHRHHLSTATFAPTGDPDAQDVVAEPAEEGEDDLRHLADALSSLLARDGDDPPLWWSSTFARRVASARSVVSSVTSASRLAAGLDRRQPPATAARGRFDADARRLARDAVSVAIAIRWLEVHQGTTLPAWPELLRRRSLAPRATDPRREASLWFG